jgi:hypothetical protein
MKKWPKISIKAILIGTLVDIGGSILVGVVIAIVLGIDFLTSGGAVLAASVVIGWGFTFLGGYVAARIAETAELMHSAIVGAIGVIFGLASWTWYPVWVIVPGLALTIPMAMLGGHFARSKGERANANVSAGIMKRLLQTIAAIFGILLLGIVAFVVYDMSFGKVYKGQLVTAEELNSEELEYVKRKGDLVQNEKILYFFSFHGIKKSGVLLTDCKVLVYEGNIVQAGNIKEIRDISILEVGSIWKLAVIVVTLKDGTQILCEIPTANNSDKKFITTLRNLSIDKTDGT